MCKLPDFPEWKRKTGLSFDVATNTDTGEIRGRRQKKNTHNVTYTHYGIFETYKLKVLETHIGDKRITYTLLIEGSLHKNYFGGKNYKQFTFPDLQIEINHLCTLLFLKPEQCKIQNLEIGVNIKTPFEVSKYINGSVLLHSTEPFERYLPDKTGFVLGRVATHTQHSIKCYDKGAQNGLDYPLMRIEDRCIKMQYLSKFELKTLKDLTDYSKVSKLENLLLAVWGDVLIYEPDIVLKDLDITQKQRELIKGGQNRDFWERSHKNNKKLFNRQRTKFRELMTVNSSLNTHSLIRELIKKEWADLFKMGTNLPSVIPL